MLVTMLRKIDILFIASSLSILLTLYSCTNARDKTITICGSIRIDRLSTTDGNNFIANALEDILFTPLANIDSRFKIHNILIEKATPAADGRIWEIKLKNGVRFHDGQPLTADDVAFSIEKRKEILGTLGAIRRTEVLDERNIRLIFDKPFRDVSDFLTNIYVYPRRIFRPGEPWKETLLKNPVGSGPFRFKKWLDNGMEFVANDDYFEGRPKTERIVYLYEGDENRRLNHLLKRKADIMTPVSPNAARFLKRDPRFYVNRVSVPYYAAVFLNNQAPVFSDLAVRKAVNMAVNREYLIENGINGGGIPAYGPFLEDMLPKGYIVAPYEYVPGAAAQLLKEAGWKDTNNDGVLEKDGKRLRLTLYYSTASDEFRRLADMVSQQLFEIGVEAETRPAAEADLRDKHLPSWEDYAILAAASMVTPEAVWQSRSVQDLGSINLANYSNMEVDDLFNRAGNEADSREIRSIYGRIDRMIHEDSPAVFLYYPVSYSAVSKRVGNGMEFRGMPYDLYKIKDVEIVSQKE